MDVIKSNCVTCGMPLLNLEICYKCSDRTAERRALYREAYMAALTGVCADPNIEKEVLAVHFAHGVAIETVRQWDAMMAELEEV